MWKTELDVSTLPVCVAGFLRTATFSTTKEAIGAQQGGQSASLCETISQEMRIQKSAFHWEFTITQLFM